MNHAQAANTLLTEARLGPEFNYYHGIQAESGYRKTIFLMDDYKQGAYDGSKVVRFLLDQTEPLSHQEFWDAVKQFQR